MTDEQRFKQDVERSIADALRVPERNVELCAEEIYNAHYKDLLPKSVLDQFTKSNNPWQ